ncbi:MAG: DUF3881 family protein [Roseburia sp.]
MHNFLRAIGFGNRMRKSTEEKLIQDIIQYPSSIEEAEDQYGNKFVEYTKEFAPSMGIKACGEYDEDGKFQMDYYYPYFHGVGITTQEEISVERHADHESYAGVCDEMKLGVTLIFYLQDVARYLEEQKRNPKMLPMSATLSALSIDGKIILPICKDEKQIRMSEKNNKNRSHLIEAAREGDEDAIESLTLEDIDTYSMLSRRITREDILSIVDTSFMPYGIESDQYAIIGEILDYRVEENRYSKDKIYVMAICCNDMIYELCINQKDLLGEPAVGRRFKGTIWMQGQIHY